MIFLFLLIAVFSSELFSETLIFKSGVTQRIKLKSQDADSITYEYKGKEVKSQKTLLRRIIFAKSNDVEDKLAKDELAKMKFEKSKKIVKSPEEEQEDARLLDEEIQKAIQEHERQEKLNLSFEERIKALEDDLFDLKGQKSTIALSRIEKIEAEIEDLKKRTRKIEEFLDIDPDFKEYYTTPRTPWSIVWRSTILPGWGLTYGRESFGNLYTSLFFVTLIGGLAYQDSLDTTERKLQNKFFNDFVLQPSLLTTVVNNSPTVTDAIKTDLTNLSNFNQNLKFFKYLQDQSDFEESRNKNQKILNLAFGIYLIQLIHSGIFGFSWAEKVKSPTKFTQETGWNFKFDSLPKSSLNPESNYKIQLGYNFSF